MAGYKVKFCPVLTVGLPQVLRREFLALGDVQPACVLAGRLYPLGDICASILGDVFQRSRSNSLGYLSIRLERYDNPPKR